MWHRTGGGEGAVAALSVVHRDLQAPAGLTTGKEVSVTNVAPEDPCNSGKVYTATANKTVFTVLTVNMVPSVTKAVTAPGKITRTATISRWSSSVLTMAL